MAGMREQFKMSESCEQSGVIFDYGGFRVRMARAGGSNKRYQKAMERETRPLKRAIQAEALPEGQANELVRRVFAEAIILDWEVRQEDGTYTQGIEGPDGDVIPFTKENVIATLEELPELFDELQSAAAKASNYREAVLEADAKNS